MTKLSWTAFSGDLLNRVTAKNKRRHSLIGSTEEEVLLGFSDVFNDFDPEKGKIQRYYFMFKIRIFIQVIAKFIFLISSVFYRIEDFFFIFTSSIFESSYFAKRHLREKTIRRHSAFLKGWQHKFYCKLYRLKKCEKPITLIIQRHS